MTTTTTTTPADISTLNAKPLAGFIMFNPWVTSYTGSKKLTPEVLGLRKEDLPPKTLASLGAMHTCDPESLQPYESARNAQRKACLKWGVQMRFGFAVVRDKALEVNDELKDIAARFYAYKAIHLPKFIQDREEWITKPEFSQWTDRIRARLHTVDYLDRQIQIGCEIFEIAATNGQPVDPTTGQAIGTSTAGVVSSIGDLALEEISADAQRIRKESIEPKGVMRLEFTQKIFSPILRIRDKAEALSFAAPVLSRVVDHINSIVGRLPQKGKLVGPDLMLVVHLVQTLCDAKSLVLSLSAVQGMTMDVSDETAQAVQAIVAAAAAGPALPELDSTPVEDDLDGTPSAATPTVAQPADDLFAHQGELVHDDL